VDIEIRGETEKDHREVEELTREAFWNLYFPGCSEHYLVNRMRSHRDFLKELDFVAEAEGRIVGNIMYTRSWLIDEDGKEKEIATFGPLSVHPDHQRRGIGGALIGHTRGVALDKGIKGIVILGDPHNYCKHGFKNGRDLGISDLNGDYPYGLLALELEDGAFAGRRWRYRYSDAFGIDEKEAEDFDRGFEPKQRAHRYSQEIFSIAFRSYLK
jgi:putative acetyltransferase